MKRLLIIIPHLDAGGAEKLVLTLCDHLDKTIFKITLLVINKRGLFSDYHNPKIDLIDLSCQSVIRASLRLFITIWRLKPDILFSNMTHLNCVIAAMKPFLPRKTVYMAREASLPSINNKFDKSGRVLDILIRYFYNRFDRIVCQSNDMKNDLSMYYKINKNKLIIINNPIITDAKDEMTPTIIFNKLRSAKTILITVCRLSREKGLDLIMRALALLAEKDFIWVIIGDGAEKGALISLARSFNIIDRILFIGSTKYPGPYIKLADIYLQGSRYEGFPNVLLESISCGVPVIAFDCPGGTKEIIRPYLNGFLVKPFDIQQYAEAVQKAMKYKFIKSKMIDDIIKRFNVKKIIKEYEQLYMRRI